jgi:hypothetical protein
MKTSSILAAVLSLLMMALGAGRVCGSEPASEYGPPAGSRHGVSGPPRCTVFTVSKGERVFLGGNDDYINPDSTYWVDPGDVRRYGAIWVGSPDNVQQGVNEKGLAYDANGLPRANVNPHDEREPVTGGYTDYPIHILRECATVEEVIAWVQTHRWHSFMRDQMHFADASGDAVILSAGRDGEVSFTRKPAGDGFLVSTNFNVADPANGFSYPCWRYDLARERLGRLLERGDALTAEDAAAVLEAVHVDGGTGWTVSSMVADLPNGLVYLYYFHQFDRPVVLNVQDELAGPRPPGPLSGLFPEDVQREAARRYGLILRRARICRWAGLLWLGLVMVSLILMTALSPGGARGRRFWTLAALLAGPLALLAWLATGRGRRPGPWRSALREAMGDIMPTIPAFVVFLFILIFVPSVQSNPASLVALVFGLPLMTGWLVFHGPLLTAQSGAQAGRFLRDRLPHVLVTVSLGMAGTNVAVMPLVNLSLRNCPVMPPTAWTVMIWWGAVGAGALVGGALLVPYERWSVKRGFHAWGILASNEGQVRTPSWRQLKWWIPLSLSVLLAGLAAGAVLSRLVRG